jgi:hypothetical protein
MTKKTIKTELTRDEVLKILELYNTVNDMVEDAQVRRYEHDKDKDN